MTERKSAVSTVGSIGYDLVKKRKRRKGPPASIEDYAALDFEPWEEMRPIPPSVEDLQAWGNNARIAYQTLTRTKPQLIEMVDQLDAELLDETMACIADATKRFKAMVLICDTAFNRLLVAASAHEVGKDNRKRTKAEK